MKHRVPEFLKKSIATDPTTILANYARKYGADHLMQHVRRAELAAALDLVREITASARAENERLRQRVAELERAADDSNVDCDWTLKSFPHFGRVCVGASD